MPKTSNIVYLDFETTWTNSGTGHDDAEIVYIHAAPQGNGKEFSRFIVPEGNFHPSFTQWLYKNDYGELVSTEDDSILDDADSPEDGLDAFIEYLGDISRQNGNVSLVLVAHDCFAFQAKVFCNQLVYHGIDVPSELIGGFNDSLQIARIMWESPNGYSLRNLMFDLLDRSLPTEHDAREEARGTRDIVRAMAKQSNSSVEDFVNNHAQKDFDVAYEAAEARMD